MLILLILNLIGLICGFSNATALMYIIFGGTWIVFFFEYSKITWRFYKPLIENENTIIIVNVKYANAISVISTMGCIYFLLYFRTGGLCVIVSVLQCFLFQLVYTFREYCNKNVMMLMGFIMEFVFAVVLIAYIK